MPIRAQRVAVLSKGRSNVTPGMGTQPRGTAVLRSYLMIGNARTKHTRSPITPRVLPSSDLQALCQPRHPLGIVPTTYPIQIAQNPIFLLGDH